LEEETMGKARVAPRDEYRIHPVMLALSKARALAWSLEQLGESGPYDNGIVSAIRGGNAPDETLGWLHSAVADALAESIEDAEAAFRKSLTPEQAHEQVLGSVAPKAVA
jgi:hypothetical protein